MEEPEFRVEYERTRRELVQVNAVMRALAELRGEAGWSRPSSRDIGRGILRDNSRIAVWWHFKRMTGLNDTWVICA